MLDTSTDVPHIAGVEVVAPELRHRAIRTLTLAFADDPPCRWLYREEAKYWRFFPRFAAAFGGAAINHGTALSIRGHSGVALWMPPGVGPDEKALGALIEASVAADRTQVVFDLFNEMGRVHPSEPHWYLPLIGVTPANQGRGLGAALLRSVLAECDATGLPAYLEATSLRSIPLYSRHGFQPLGEIRVGSCPPIVPMLRRPTLQRS